MNNADLLINLGLAVAVNILTALFARTSYPREYKFLIVFGVSLLLGGAKVWLTGQFQNNDWVGSLVLIIGASQAFYPGLKDKLQLLEANYGNKDSAQDPIQSNLANP